LLKFNSKYFAHRAGGLVKLYDLTKLSKNTFWL